MKTQRIHFAPSGNPNLSLCPAARAAGRPVTTVEPSRVTCARCLKSLSTSFVTFADVLPGERFNVYKKRGGRVWRFVKVLEFVAEDGIAKNAIEVGSGHFWQVALPQMPVEVYRPIG